MATHFQWYPSSEETVVPFNARYSFPTQANKAVKVTPRVPPVAGTTFTPAGGPIRITLPAQGYLNPRNSTLEFDVVMTPGSYTYGTDGTAVDQFTAQAYSQTLRFQNNIQSIFARARLMYGSTPLEDIGNYNVIVRALTEWTTTNQNGTLDQTGLSEGIGGVATGVNGGGIGDFENPGMLDVAQTAYLTTGNALATVNSFAGVYAAPTAGAIGELGTGTYVGQTTQQQRWVNTRQKYIQGISYPYNQGGAGTAIGNASAERRGNFGHVPNGAETYTTAFVAETNITTTPGSAPLTGSSQTCVRRYQVQLGFGLLAQEKLIPLKWMASQLTIELTLAQPESCMFQLRHLPGAGTTALTTVSAPTYSVTNVNYIPEILEFDASYDAMFLKGLREGGVPIKFASWHTYAFNAGLQNNINFIIPEKSRSVKALFVLQRRAADLISTDSGASFFCTKANGSNALPGPSTSHASNTDLTTTGATGGALQSYQFRVGGRYFPAAPVQCSTTPSSAISNGGAEAFTELQKALNQIGDYRLSTSLNPLRWAVPMAIAPGIATSTVQRKQQLFINEADYSGGDIKYFDKNGIPICSTVGPQAASLIGSTQFACAIDFETASGVDIAGLNAEEQSDIAFIAQYSDNQAANQNLEAYVYYDAMIVLRENNVLELIQ